MSHGEAFQMQMSQPDLHAVYLWQAVLPAHLESLPSLQQVDRELDMGDNGFSNFMKKAESPFRLFAAETMLPVFGNSNASATTESGTQAPSATEPAASGASELPFGPCQYLTCMHRPNEAGCARPATMRSTCRHQWLRPDNGTIECAVCGATRNDYSRPTARR